MEIRITVKIQRTALVYVFKGWKENENSITMPETVNKNIE